MRAVFVDANATLAGVTEQLHRADDFGLTIYRNPDVKPDELPNMLGGADVRTGRERRQVVGSFEGSRQPAGPKARPHRWRRDPHGPYALDWGRRRYR